VTHVDPRCQASCVAVAVAISEMLKGEELDASLEKGIALGLEV
jgi:ADP-ribosylglycohydrolase